MDKVSVLEKTLTAFSRYYDINTENPTSPFVAEASFHSHTEQYFLLKEAKLSEIESSEYVFFAHTDFLSQEKLLQLDERAWSVGLSRVKPTSSHRNSDVTLVLIADKVDESAFNLVKKLKHYKSYSFTFKGWSNYRVILLETSSSRIVHNRMGSSLKKIFSNI